MTETLIITTKQSQNNASTLAQRYGGAVAIPCPVFINQNGSLSTTKSDSTIDETQGLKLAEWHSDNNYSGSEIERTFSTSGIMVNPYTYVIGGSFDGDVEILNKNTNLNIWLVDQNGVKFYPKK